MLKSILTIVSFLAVSFAVQAQSKAGIHIGYGTETERPLFGINAEFGVTNQITVAPDFSYYLTQKHRYLTTTMWEVNANAHYYFQDKKDFRIFGLGGINYSHVKVSSELSTLWAVSSTATSGKAGFNLGGGGTYALGTNMEAFSTLKYTIGSADQVVLFGGLRYIF
ncbi:outer membrane protein [Flavobacterium sp. JP2137]|uniref:outer membrane protein n=1 Tax=Flavobacterium sp. JP2137 TaxID=3414510 RepID=UPI003D2FC583